MLQAYDNCRWVNAPPCDNCGKETVNEGMGVANPSETCYGASRVELYRYAYFYFFSWFCYLTSVYAPWSFWLENQVLKLSWESSATFALFVTFSLVIITRILKNVDNFPLMLLCSTSLTIFNWRLLQK